MKISTFFLSLLVLPLFFISCSREPAGPGANIDVAANTERLKSANPTERMDAAANLGMAGEKAAPAIPELISLLKDPNPEVRRLAAYALGEIGPKASAAVPELKAMTRDRNAETAMQAVHSLRNIEPESAPQVEIMNVTRP
jgi:HEAT repeat protein